MGNIEFLILTIGSVVFFTLLLVTGNTMAIAVRERTGELAVLKTVGFSDGFVLWLVLGESLLLALVGGVLGILAAKGGSPGLSGLIAGMVVYLPTSSLVAGLVLALAVGLLAGALPAVAGDAAQGRRRAAEGVTMAIPLVYNVRSVRQRWTSWHRGGARDRRHGDVARGSRSRRRRARGAPTRRGRARARGRR